MRFIVLGSARTGSTYLIRLLEKHPNIESHKELLNLDNFGAPKLRRVFENPIKYFESELQSKTKNETLAIGCKILYGNATPSCLFAENHVVTKFRNVHKQLRDKIQNFFNHIHANYDLSELEKKLNDLWEYIQSDTELRIIHIKRKNKLAAFASLTNAYTTNEWNVQRLIHSGQRPREQTQSISLSYDDCLDFFKSRSEMESLYDSLFSSHKCVSIQYEKLCDDLESELSKIYTLLQVPTIDVPKTDIVKQNQRTLSESIANYTELKQRFEGTSWETYFDE